MVSPRKRVFHKHSQLDFQVRNGDWVFPNYYGRLQKYGNLYIFKGYCLLFFMMWQDLVVGIVSFVFAYAMLPQIIYGFKKKRGVITYQFSVLNMICMVALIIAYYSLGLVFATAISVIIMIGWTILFIQKLIYDD